MPDRLIVIAGDFGQYRNFCQEYRLDPRRDAMYPTAVHFIQGLRGGQYICIGTYQETRRDLREMLAAEVARMAKSEGEPGSLSVHMPRIGCGLAGGTWERIEPLIVKVLCERGIPVTVYDLP